MGDTENPTEIETTTYRDRTRTNPCRTSCRPDPHKRTVLRAVPARYGFLSTLSMHGAVLNVAKFLAFFVKKCQNLTDFCLNLRYSPEPSRCAEKTENGTARNTATPSLAESDYATRIDLLLPFTLLISEFCTVNSGLQFNTSGTQSRC